MILDIQYNYICLQMPSSNLSWQQNICFNLLDWNVELHTLLVKFGQHPEQNDLDEWGPPLENGEASLNTKMVVYVGERLYSFWMEITSRY